MRDATRDLDTEFGQKGRKLDLHQGLAVSRQVHTF